MVVSELLLRVEGEIGPAKMRRWEGLTFPCSCASCAIISFNFPLFSVVDISVDYTSIAAESENNPSL
jgi:hypothetical protein